VPTHAVIKLDCDKEYTEHTPAITPFTVQWSLDGRVFPLTCTCPTFKKPARRLACCFANEPVSRHNTCQCEPGQSRAEPGLCVLSSQMPGEHARFVKFTLQERGNPDVILAHWTRCDNDYSPSPLEVRLTCWRRCTVSALIGFEASAPNRPSTFGVSLPKGGQHGPK